MSLMIDIEAIGTTHDSVILTIGMAKFSLFGNGVEGTMEIKLTIEDQIEVYGRIMCEDTVKWWGRQSKYAIEAAFSDEGRDSFFDGMTRLAGYAKGEDSIWAHGPLFDIGMIEHGMTQTGVKVPWHFSKIRDTRTAYSMAEVSLKHTDVGLTKTTHNAVDDAIHQVYVLQEAYRRLGVKKRAKN